MPNVQIPPGLSESDDVDHDQTQGGTEGNPHGDSAASADVSSIQSSADVDHDNTSGGTAGNPHSSSASTNHGNAAHSANFETDSGAQSRVDSHENKNNPHSSSASTNHGNAAHNTTFAADGDPQPPLNHGNGAHVANFITGAIIERVKFTSSGTYTIPNDADQLVVEAIGAGQQGGDQIGGAGGRAVVVILPADDALTGDIPVEIGAGGPNKGGNSKFGPVTAPGGGRGDNGYSFPGGSTSSRDSTATDSAFGGGAGGNIDSNENDKAGGAALLEDPNGGGAAGGGDGVNGGGGGANVQESGDLSPVAGDGGVPGGGGGASSFNDVNEQTGLGADGRVIVWAL